MPSLSSESPENASLLRKLGKLMLIALAQRCHTTYPGNNMCQKCKGKSGLWVFHEMINKTYAENREKNVGAIWELPAK